MLRAVVILAGVEIEADPRRKSHCQRTRRLETFSLSIACFGLNILSQSETLGGRLLQAVHQVAGRAELVEWNRRDSRRRSFT